MSVRFDRVQDVAELESVYGEPGRASISKVANRITPSYRALLEASPFFAMATAGPEGLDCSPRGELGGAFRIADEETIIIPDRRGNNRIDTLRNIVRDGRIALLFLIPGSGTTIRLNGTACVTLDAALLESMARDGKAPRSAIVVSVEQIYFQCARAVVRSGLWDPEKHVDPKTIPTPGQLLQDLDAEAFAAEAYDREWPGRAAKSLW